MPQSTPRALIQIFVISVLSVVSVAFSFAQLPPIEPGVSQELAKWRAARYSNVRYKLNLTLEKMSPVLKGTVEIRVNVARGQRASGLESNANPIDTAIVLDWRKIKGHEEKSTISNVTLNAIPLVSGPMLWNEPGRPFKYSQHDDHIVLYEGVREGENVIKLDFTSPILTSGSAITRYIDKEDGSEYIYSLFVPSDASTSFPVFDQPDLKAKFTLRVIHPTDWSIVSNAAILAPPHMPLQVVTETGEERWTELIRTGFAETKPISTYVFAFAAGPFKQFRYQFGDLMKSADETYFKRPRDPNAFEMGVFVRKSQAAKFQTHARAVYDLNRQAIRFFEEYFNYKFPFPKYDLVLIPEFPFGGMEHAGATFLRESAIIFPQEPTRNDHISRALLMFHEASHQWFGDTVTMRWFDDLWLKEGFATFTAYKAMEKIMPEMMAWKVFYERVKQAAYQTDSTRGTTAIYQPIANLSAAKSAYGNIVYNKAPAFLRQAEFYLGEDKFQTAVRGFLKKNEFGNAGWEDLVKEFANVSWQQFSGMFNVHFTSEENPDGSRAVTKSYEEPRRFSSKERAKAEQKGRANLKAWADNWVSTRGLSVVRYHWGTRYSPNGGLALKQTNALGEMRLSDIESEALVRYGSLNNTLTLRLKRDEKQADLNVDTMIPSLRRGDVILTPLSSSPVLIFLNYRDYDYGIFLLDDKSREYVLKNIQNEKDPFLRSMMWGALWDSVREAELDPKAYLELAITNLPLEQDETMAASIAGRVGTALNYYVSDKTREEFAPRIEKVFSDKMKTAPTLGQRVTFYRAFLNSASSDNARGVLKDILNLKFEILDLKLKTKDKFDIVTRLLILGDPDAPKLLAELEKTETSDDAKRYAYAARAGIPMAENKAKYWNDFVNNKEISESWIEAAFGPWNSIRHSDLTLAYLERALKELPNHKRSRKIFFVNGWLAAFIGGQRSEEASRIVNEFLADNPSLDKDLQLKILENVDIIERAVRIRKKYGRE